MVIMSWWEELILLWKKDGINLNILDSFWRVKVTLYLLGNIFVCKYWYLSQNTLSWMIGSWPCTGHPRTHTMCPGAVSKHFLDSEASCCDHLPGETVLLNKLHWFTPKQDITLSDDFSVNYDLIFTQSGLRWEIQDRVRIQTVRCFSSARNDLVPWWIPQILNGKCRHTSMEWAFST